MAQRRFFELTSPDQFFIHNALLAELVRAADFAVSLIVSVEASARKAAGFLSVGIDDNMVSLDVLFLM